MDTHHVTFTEEQQGLRIDKALSDSPDFSRARLTSIIREEGVLLDGELCMEPKRKSAPGRRLMLLFRTPSRRAGAGRYSPGYCV